MGISTPGIGSNLDVDGIISKLMTVEAAPLASYDKQTASYQAKLSAYGTLSGSIGSFQASLAGLSSLSSFQSLTSASSDTSVMVGSSSSKTLPGTYKVNVTQLAQAQTLATTGFKTSTSSIGTGASTTISFQLGTTSGGTFGADGTALANSVRSGGITPGSLSINGTTIITDSGTRSAKLLADAINAKSATSGVSAVANETVTSETLFGSGGATSFGPVDTSGGGSYALTVGGVTIGQQAGGVLPGAAGALDAAGIDSALASASVQNALEEANITVTGSAALGTLQFKNSDGSNIAITEAVGAGVKGGIGKTSATANAGGTITTSSTISLVSNDASQITVGGTNPALAGLSAGIVGKYSDAGFEQDGTQLSGSIVIDTSNNTLQGIRDAINKGAFGVTATIVSDGSDLPNHLVLTSTKTGVTSSMKITLSGDGTDPADPALEALLGYDPAGVQNLSQKASAQDTLLTVGGIAIKSASTTVDNPVEGVSLTIGKVGSANLVVTKDNTSMTTSINAFVKAYNDLNTQIKTLTGYNAETKTGGALLGDSTALSLQRQLRNQLSEAIPGLTGSLKTISDVGISFQKDGTLLLDSAKLQKAVTNNFADIASLFAVVGKSTDANVKFTSSTVATKAGDYALDITTVASQGSMSGDAGSPLPATTVIAADTKWVVSLNDTVPSKATNTSTVTIPAGSYSQAQLATLLQSSINGASNFSTAGSAVTATTEGGVLKIVSNRYGSTSNLTISSSSGSTVAGVFGAEPTVAAGVDVAGTIGGYAATGSGQVLTGGAGAPVEGLKVTVDGGATGSRGTIGFSQGYAYQLTNMAASFLGSKGTLTSRTTGLNSSIKDVAKQKEDFNDRLVDIEARYRKQYTALDTTIASMNTTTSFLTQQFAALAANS